uniref:Uncharacterized protein n=1 Tax=Eptatretus burgeri TaxID=7764 RepID=A0A8C4QEM0_EPTBU
MLQRYVAYRDVSVRFLYCTGTLGFALGLITMAAFPTLHVCMIGVATMGLLFIVLLYCPYAILGLYHEDKEYIAHSPDGTKRGLGIDCAILSCQAYVSQIIVASTISAIIKAAGTVRVVPFFAAIFALLAFLAAAFLVHYPSMKENEDDDYVQASCGDGDLGNDECDRVGGMDERRNEKTQSGEAMAGAMGSSSAEQLGLGKRLQSIDISMETAV